MFGFAILGLVLVSQGTVKDSIDCGKMVPFEDYYTNGYPRLFIKDTSIQVSDDSYISDQKVIFKTQSKCFDLGNEFSAVKLAEASRYFPELDFSRFNSVEYFLEYYFAALARAKYKSYPPYIAYSKEYDSNGERFIAVGSIQKVVTNQRWGSYEEYGIPKLECISIGKKG